MTQQLLCPTSESLSNCLFLLSRCLSVIMEQVTAVWQMNHITDSMGDYMQHHEIKKSFSHTRILITHSQVPWSLKHNPVILADHRENTETKDRTGNTNTHNSITRCGHGGAVMFFWTVYTERWNDHTKRRYDVAAEQERWERGNGFRNCIREVITHSELTLQMDELLECALPRLRVRKLHMHKTKMGKGGHHIGWSQGTTRHHLTLLHFLHVL